MLPEPGHPAVDATAIDTFDQDRNTVLHLIDPLIDAVDRDVDATFTHDTVEDRLLHVKEAVQPERKTGALRTDIRPL